MKGLLGNSRADQDVPEDFAFRVRGYVRDRLAWIEGAGSTFRVLGVVVRVHLLGIED